jgi:hypothetical protein
VSQATYCLKYVDFTGCESWWAALKWSHLNEGIDWNGGWGKVETVILRTAACKIEAPTTGEDASDAAVEYAEYKERERRNKARHTARSVKDFIHSERRRKGGNWCKVVIDEDIQDGLTAR